MFTLRPVKFKRINNVTNVEGTSVNGELQAARAAWGAGAAETARMFRELIQANDLRGLVALAKATETNSFYPSV